MTIKSIQMVPCKGQIVFDNPLHILLIFTIIMPLKKNPISNVMNYDSIFQNYKNYYVNFMYSENNVLPLSLAISSMEEDHTR